MRFYELFEGGKAIQGVGKIHISEVDNTLWNLEKDLNMPGLRNNVLGSVGKKQYSGDIDIALAMDDKQKVQFKDLLSRKFGEDFVVLGSALSIKYPIMNYQPQLKDEQPRTGYVQIDFFITKDVEWAKQFYYAPDESSSKYKGVHRQIALASVAKYVDSVESKETDSYDRPIKTVRWKYSVNDGLVRVARMSVKSQQTGTWLKQQKDEIVGASIKDMNKIAHILFNGKAKLEDLNTFEGIIAKIKETIPKEKQDVIFSQIANGIQKSKVDDYQFPKEIEQYMNRNIKESDEQHIEDLLSGVPSQEEVIKRLKDNFKIISKNAQDNNIKTTYKEKLIYSISLLRDQYNISNTKFRTFGTGKGNCWVATFPKGELWISDRGFLQIRISFYYGNEDTELWDTYTILDEG